MPFVLCNLGMRFHHLLIMRSISHKPGPVRLTPNALAQVGREQTSMMDRWYKQKDPYERFKATGQGDSRSYHKQEMDVKRLQREAEARKGH